MGEPCHGAFVDCIDGIADDPSAHRFWMLYINGEEASVGVSKAIIMEDKTVTSAVVEWRYADASKAETQQVVLKTKSLPITN